MGRVVGRLERGWGAPVLWSNVGLGSARAMKRSTERALTRRYFEGRRGGLKPCVPGRILTAIRR
jgi:hypothetical protein